MAGWRSSPPMSSTTRFAVLLGNGDGTFWPQDRLPGRSPSVFGCSRDLNGDGKLDAVTATDHSVSVLLRNEKWHVPGESAERTKARTRAGGPVSATSVSCARVSASKGATEPCRRD